MVLRLSTFFSDVLGTVATGLSTATSTAIVATDSILIALGKTQGQLNLKAPLANPTFTGTPLAPTAANLTNTTQLATTAFVQSSLTLLSSGRSTTAYTGTGTQTAFTIPSAVTVNDVIVNVGGLIVEPTVSYTISGTTLTFATAPDNGTIIWIMTLATVFAGGPYTTSSADTTITGNWTFTNPILGTTVMSYNSDVAERYASDAAYDPGTVMVFGGTNEITACTTPMDHRVAGVISEYPAFRMNGNAGPDSTHPYVALIGRVPCKVVGRITKGDMLVTSDITGHAVAVNHATAINPDINLAYRVIGKSLNNKYDSGYGIVEIALSR